MAETDLMAAADLWIGEMRRFEVAGTPVLLVRVELGVFAYEDRCAHLGVALSEGVLEGCTLTCKAHHYQYDVRTGLGLNPVGSSLRPLTVREHAGRLLLVSEGGG
jgi:nitrite reductase/ring-hydroxylating ferredoxin subunit